MKKLIIIDHLGEKVFEEEVFLEGKDFEHIEDIPKPIWLKKLLIVDPAVEVPTQTTLELEVTPEPEEKVEPQPEPEPEPTTEELEAIQEEQAKDEAKEIDNAIKVKCSECGWTGTRGQCPFGHNDVYCPECNKEALEEVKDEPETISPKSPSSKGTPKAKPAKSPKKPSKKPARK